METGRIREGSRSFVEIGREREFEEVLGTGLFPQENNVISRPVRSYHV